MNWEQILTFTFLIQVVAASMRLGGPIIIAAVGEIYAERAGVFNLSVDGVMLLGGFMGFIVAYESENLWMGVIAATTIGAIMGLIFAFWTISMRANQIVTGFTLLILSTGSAIYFNRLAFPTTGTALMPSVPRFRPLEIPLLSKIPVLGPILFSHNALTYLFAGLLVLSTIILFKTRYGLRITAVGEYPAAADTVGVNVKFIRYSAVVIGAALAGLGGGYFSLAELGLFNESMVGGRGFIALALVIFGRWNPLLAAAGGLIFGAIDALQFRLQFLGAPVPSQLLIALPYVLTIIVLLFGRGRLAPAAITKAYTRE
jgi:simple sugar transport system permease protein